MIDLAMGPFIWLVPVIWLVLVFWVVPASGPMAGSAGGGRRVRARRGARCALLPRDCAAAAFAARARAPPFRRADRLGLGRTRIRLVPVDIRRLPLTGAVDQFIDSTDAVGDLQPLRAVLSVKLGG